MNELRLYEISVWFTLINEEALKVIKIYLGCNWQYCEKNHMYLLKLLKLNELVLSST